MKPRRSASLQREPIQWEAVSEFLQFSLYLNVTSGSAYTSFHGLRTALGPFVRGNFFGRGGFCRMR